MKNRTLEMRLRRLVQLNKPFIQTLAVIAYLIPSGMVKAQSFPLEGLGEEEAWDILCPIFISTERDALGVIFSDEDGWASEMVAACANFLPHIEAKATVKTNAPEDTHSLSSKLVERFNSWVSSEDGIVSIAIMNPFPVELAGLTVEHANGSCSVDNSYTFVDLDFLEPLTPHDSTLVKFSMPNGMMAGAGCINVITTSPSLPNQSPEQLFSDITALVKAEQWHEAGLLYELANHAQMPSPSGFRENIFETTKREVRAIPASQAVNGGAILGHSSGGTMRSRAA